MFWHWKIISSIGGKGMKEGQLWLYLFVGRLKDKLLGVFSQRSPFSYNCCWRPQRFSNCPCSALLDYSGAFKRLPTKLNCFPGRERAGYYAYSWWPVRAHSKESDLCGCSCLWDQAVNPLRLRSFSKAWEHEVTVRAWWGNHFLAWFCSCSRQ